MASSRVGSRISERIGPRLPRVLGAEVASMRWIMGIRKLRVLPVPVEAVARMSLPSRAGGMALAWTGVGVTKPALARRDFRESEMSKSLKRTSPTRERPFGLADRGEAWIVAVCCSVGSRVAEFKMIPYKVLIKRKGVQGCRGTMDFLSQHCCRVSKRCCCTARLVR